MLPSQLRPHLSIETGERETRCRWTDRRGHAKTREHGRRFAHHRRLGMECKPCSPPLFLFHDFIVRFFNINELGASGPVFSNNCFRPTMSTQLRPHVSIENRRKENKAPRDGSSRPHPTRGAAGGALSRPRDLNGMSAGKANDDMRQCAARSPMNRRCLCDSSGSIPAVRPT